MAINYIVRKPNDYVYWQLDGLYDFGPPFVWDYGRDYFDPAKGPIDSAPVEPEPGGNMTIRIKFTAYDSYTGLVRDVTDWQEVSVEDEKYLQANLALMRDVYKLTASESLRIQTQQPTVALDITSIKDRIAQQVKEKEQAGLKSKLRNDIRRYQESELKRASSLEALQTLAAVYKDRLSLVDKVKEAVNVIAA